ncbi:MAG TPA: glycogen debranching N-terminal domain-containing protein [Candidatus Binatia bacterium]|nr:glycogen debranching N-terminal domain-containing protein [Candidatus Binatia bacterium]
MEPATTDVSVTLVEHTNFAVSDRAGDMLPGSYHGFFVADTRVLSRLVVRVGGKRLEPLASGGEDHGAGTFYLANPRLPGAAASTIAAFRDRRISRHLEERIRLISYAPEPLELTLTIEIDADFADIFEVRGRRQLRRRITKRHRPQSVRFSYAHRGYRRSTTVSLDRPATARDGRLTLPVTLERGMPWDLNLRVEEEQAHAAGITPPLPPRPLDPDRVRAWFRGLPTLSSADPRLRRTWHRAVRDLASLLLTGPAGNFIPAAGLPWFLAIFGRDSAITAMQSLLLGWEVPDGTLRQLGLYQGTKSDAWREEEPGKIPHEVRTGELATLGRIPFGRYYGSVDSTPLYVMLYVAACRRSGWLRRGRAGQRLPAALAEFLPRVEAAMGWIEARSDADGLIWYHRGRRGGITNQVWKDSADSMRYADGRVAQPSIAAVEVQGYVVAARRGMAQLYRALGRADDAAAQKAAADRLAAVIESAFWMPAEGTYALGLDEQRQQIDGIGSNAGHLLWAGTVPPDRAASVTERLMAPDMFSGWGIRTLSARNPGYNPIGYHIGSIWPHDNSLIADGMARSGQVEAAVRLIDALLDAAVADPLARLPELFAGFDRAATPDLVPYPTACSPQAWATGAIFQFVETILGMPVDTRPERWAELKVSGSEAQRWAGGSADAAGHVG